MVCLDAPDADAPMPDIDPSSGTPEASEAARAEAKGGEAQQTGRQPGHPSVSSVPARYLMCCHVERLMVM